MLSDVEECKNVTETISQPSLWMMSPQKKNDGVSLLTSQKKTSHTQTTGVDIDVFHDL